jgi:hypothetical protein
MKRTERVCLTMPEGAYRAVAMTLQRVRMGLSSRANVLRFPVERRVPPSVTNEIRRLNAAGNGRHRGARRPAA